MPGDNNYNLTEGALEIIMKGGDVDHPIVQILGCKKITSGGGDKNRYRILVSDGKNSISFAMLTISPQDPAIKDENGIEMFSVIKIEKYITSILNNAGRGDHRILLIMEMNLLVPGSVVGKKIGLPTALTDTVSKNSSTNDNRATSSSTSTTSHLPKPSNSNVTVSMSNGEQSLAGTHTHPISSLSPYHNKWIIKARVTNKSNIRTWSNSKGEGKLFSFELVDESGEIRATAFRDDVDKFYDYLQVDKIYYISKCQLKPANKQFNNLKNDYEMTLTPETIIQECQDADTSAIPQTKYNFVTIDTIANLEANSLIDVIGVVKEVSDLQTLQSRATGRELKKKDVTLMDQSKSAITLTLWGSDAEGFEASGNPVIVLKGARISEFGGGKNLSTISGTTLKVNPELRECYRLRSWYDNEGENVSATNLSAKSGAGNFNTPWMSFKEVQDQNLGNAERGDYYQVKGTVLLIRSENAMYKACPTAECNKKVIDLENGMYRCEKCNREYPNFKYRLLASMNVGDWSGNQWVSMFSSEVEKVLGKTSQEVGERIEQDSEAIHEIVDLAHFKQFIMKCRAKMETYNDESRLKTVCIKVDPVNHEEYNAHLIKKIEEFVA